MIISKFLPWYFAVSPKSQSSNSTQTSDRKSGEEISKRRKTSSAKQEIETTASADETFTLPPCLVNLGPGVRVSAVAAGGRHTLALTGKLLFCVPPPIFWCCGLLFVVTKYSFVGL